MIHWSYGGVVVWKVVQHIQKNRIYNSNDCEIIHERDEIQEGGGGGGGGEREI